MTIFEFKKFFLIIFLIIVLIYVTNITNIPKRIVLFEGEKLNLKTVFGIFKTKEKIIPTSLDTEDSNVINEESIVLSLFNIFNVKTIDVTTIENTKVIPLRKYRRTKAIF